MNVIKTHRRYQENYSMSTPARKLKDVLEKKIEDLSRQLTEERILARKDKQQVTRLQREIARHRGDRDRTGKEIAMKDLERERLARADAEQRLREMTLESNNCRTRLMALQDEFKRMEEVVKNMMQYKTKIEQLKQEKSSLSITYENNILKYRNHISTLERENIMLMNDVRKFESQMSGKADDHSKHLLERLKVLELENTTLVQENEHQRQQYEKCLDEIANQVVQALLAQKALREECLKLQTKVQDLEYQNHELNTIFKHKYSSDTMLQITQSQNGSTSTLCDSNSLTAHSSVSNIPTPAQFSSAIALTQTMHLSPMSQYVLQTMVAQKCMGTNLDAGTNSIESLQSVCSDYTCDESIGKPQMSSPVVWPDGKTGIPTNPVAIATSGFHSSADKTKEYNRRTKIETEFPATNSSPKIKHVSVLERAKQNIENSLSATSLQSVPRERQMKNTTSLTKSKMSIPQAGVGLEGSGMPHRTPCVQTEISGQMSLSHNDHTHKVSVINPDHPVLKPRRGSAGRIIVPRERSSSSSSLREKALMRERSSSASSAIPVKRGSKSQRSIPQASLSKATGKSRQDGSKESICSSSSSIHSAKSDSKLAAAKVGQGHKATGSDRSVKDKMAALKESLGSPPRVPLLPNAQYFYDYSDEDSDFNRPTSCNLSNTSTISLNEILDDDDDTDTLLDEEFCTEKFAFFDSPSFVKKCDEHSKKNISKNSDKKNKDLSGLHGKPDIVKDTEYSEYKNQVKSPHVPRKRNSLQHHRTKRVQGVPRPSSLILAPREKQFIYQGYSSSSSSLESSESDENWSPKFARKQYNIKQSRVVAKCRISPQSLPSPTSDITSRKSSREETMSPIKVSQVDVISPVSSPNHLMTSSTESNPCSSNSLSRKKGPPPPVPKKPLTGRRSPGIKMGLQSPGFRCNKKDVTEVKTVNISLKPQEIKTEGCSEDKSENCLETQAEVKDTNKYLSTELTFDNVKVDKVERSGSKDDGYSTMSSDIQPEAMEKFSDASLQKKESVIVKETNTKVEEQQQPETPGVKVSKSGAELTSDPDSAMDCSIHSTEMRNSNHSLSSQNSNSSEDRAAAYGSLGRVKAMKMLFEAESQKQNDNKIVKFPLRKSPSVDSKLGGNKESHINRNLNRRSLGDDSRMFSSEIHGNVDVDFSKLLLGNTREQSTNNDDEITCLQTSSINSNGSAPPLLPDTTMSVSTPAVFQHVQMLNISEENFLSDIPEEKDEWDASTNSCEKILEASLKNLQSSTKYHAHLQLLQSFTVKRHWSSLQGLSRVMSDSDLTSTGKGQCYMDDVMSCDVAMPKPLERSMSLSDLQSKRSSKTRSSIKIVPKLRKVSLIQKNVCELSDLQRVQMTLKDQILKQLANKVESESDDDDFNGFQPLIAQGHLMQKSQGHSPQVTPTSYHSCSPPVMSQSSGHHSNPPHHGNQTTSQYETSETASQPDGELQEQRRLLSSKESSPCPEQQDTGKFRSDYYSLCTVGSNKSLFSGSNEGENDPVVFPPKVHTCQTEEGQCDACNGAKNSNEFDEISRQLENLSKTVNALHKSLTSLNSCDSDNESNEDHTPLCQPEGGNFGDTEGYQWVEDEFYLTPCGGEIILGSSPFSETGACCDWVNEYADDTSCNDEFEFYGNFSSEDQQQHAGMSDMRPAYSPIKEEERDFSASIVDRQGAGEVYAPGINENSEQGDESRSRQSSTERDSEDADVSDPKTRAAMLDSMVHLSGASMDSLDDNIGVDHVMCSRLLGRGEKMNAMRSAAHSRPAIDLSKFFLRFGDQEKEAVAAFDFLNEITTSPEHTAVDQSTNSSSNQSVHQSHTETSNQSLRLSHTEASNQSLHLSHTETSNQSLHLSHTETSNRQSVHVPHTGSWPSTTRAEYSQICVKQPQGLANESKLKKKNQEKLQTFPSAEINKARNVNNMSSTEQPLTRQAVPKTSFIPKVTQAGHHRHGTAHSPVPRLGVNSATSHGKSDTPVSALKQAMGLAEGNPPSHLRAEHGLASSHSKKGSGLVVSKSVMSDPKDIVPNKRGTSAASESKSQDKTQNGACAVPASPKLSRIGFFRRKSSEKKVCNEEKPTKLPKKTSQGAKEKDKSKIPKAVKQEQNSSKSGRKFLQRTSSSSSSKSSSSTSPAKGGHS